MSTITITEFLEARIAEDEERNNPAPDPSGSCDYLHGVHYESARVLAECAAKRAIVADFISAASPESWWSQDAIKTNSRWSEALLLVLHRLAAVYADHPDYRQEWAL